jgi:two-component system, OmpR family, heavy metal sensor histidine kinase CusS
LTNAPAELMPVIHRLNDLLRRLEDAFSREKAFTADVAHELRTPLAGLRATLEVSLSQSREPEKHREAIRDSLQVAHQMQDMVDNLLWLARTEAGQLRVDRGPVDLGDLLNECWKTLADRAQTRGLCVDWDVHSPCALSTDRDKLRQAVHNLLDNAVTHADSGGRVRIEAGREPDRIRCRITNTGSRISPEDAERVFDRFWRGDQARTDTGVHCGLGLSLSRRIVTLLGGRISVTSAVGGEFSVTMVFPNH